MRISQSELLLVCMVYTFLAPQKVRKAQQAKRLLPYWPDRSLLVFAWCHHPTWKAEDSVRVGRVG